jgi:N-acetylglucosaminyldiphosphoundecaprenol N-acetyl-beta-D-mannosaminyltransferase
VNTVSHRRVDVLGVHVSAIDRPMAVEELARFIQDGSRTYVCVTGVHGIMESQRDPALAEIHNRSGLTTPDGMPMVWAARAAGAGPISRVYGPDLMLDVCERSQREGWRHFFFGAKPGVADDLAARLVGRFPGLVVAGTMSPPYGPVSAEEDARIVAALEAAQPDIVWVGLSTPKQERWMASNRDRLSASVLIGVGAAFDIHAGHLAQAPRWMQRSGLEWLFRVAIEPRRLWRRYLFNNPRFVARVVRRRPRLVPLPEAS